jgi:CBS-domain-containing membrane protein
MSSDLISVDPKITINEATKIILEHDIRHLLVKSRREFVGVVSSKDLLKKVFQELNDQNKTLHSKITELEKFYKVAVDRELIMVKLKKRIRDLEEKVNLKIDSSEFIVE